MGSLLSPEQLALFLETGYIIIENVLNSVQIETARRGIHSYIQKRYSLSHDNLLMGVNTNHKLKMLTKSLFYSKFKMDIHLDERIYLTFKEICQALDKSCKDVVPYIDRVAYRLPDHISAEGGLKMHIDRNPWNLSKAKKIRTVQAFIAITDHVGNNSGGLRVVPKFQKTFDEYFKKSYNTLESDAGGEFYRMHSISHFATQQQLTTLQVPAGALVIWDNKLPHATCEKLESFDTREVIYLSYLPTNHSINVKYWKHQLENFLSNSLPPSYDDGLIHTKVDRDYDVNDLTNFQKKMMGIV